MSRGAVAIKAKGVLAVRRRVAASPLRGGLNQPTGDHRGRGKIRTKLPDEAASEVLAHVHPVRDAPIPGAARPATDLFINTYGREYPAVGAPRSSSGSTSDLGHHQFTLLRAEPGLRPAFSQTAITATPTNPKTSAHDQRTTEFTGHRGLNQREGLCPWWGGTRCCRRPRGLGLRGRGWELIGSSVTVVVVRPLMTKIETNLMVVRLYFGRGLPVSSVSDPRWPGRVGFDTPRVKDLHEELP